MYRPSIENCLIEIAYPNTYNIDSDLTYPTPDYFYFVDDTIHVSWDFSRESSDIIGYKGISSVQVGFSSFNKMNEKDNTIFISGIIIAIDISIILQLLFVILPKR